MTTLVGAHGVGERQHVCVIAGYEKAHDQDLVELALLPFRPPGEASSSDFSGIFTHVQLGGGSRSL